jgi:hypothetical protein
MLDNIHNAGTTLFKHSGQAVAGTNGRTTFKDNNRVKERAACTRVQEMAGREKSEQTSNKFAGGALCQCFSNGCFTSKHHLLPRLTGIEPCPQGDDDIEPNHDQALDLKVKFPSVGEEIGQYMLDIPN